MKTMIHVYFQYFQSMFCGLNHFDFKYTTYRATGRSLFLGYYDLSWAAVDFSEDCHFPLLFVCNLYFCKHRWSAYLFLKKKLVQIFFKHSSLKELKEVQIKSFKTETVQNMQDVF